MGVKRPDWWPDWVPETCANGHALLPGAVTSGWVWCDCPGASANGHNEWRCGVIGCRWTLLPPEHTGARREQR